MQARAAVGNRWTPDGLAHGIYTEARGERAKHEAEAGTPEPVDVEVIDVSEYHPPRIPSKKWRERSQATTLLSDMRGDPHAGAFRRRPVMSTRSDLSVIPERLPHATRECALHPRVRRVAPPRRSCTNSIPSR